MVQSRPLQEYLRVAQPNAETGRPYSTSAASLRVGPLPDHFPQLLNLLHSGSRFSASQWQSPPRPSPPLPAQSILWCPKLTRPTGVVCLTVDGAPHGR
ncbi:hypothetical protein PAL_GLEAN10004589 [Pteropus alecto]|uniref:Uncharacterized protein n=1 Tax=Pteropus alecto TaxID=9402 RepID=L5L5M5_PTEAL|nr:hypothetical protein PAL_GLEAN10004589 [Pteropus alecto]